MTCWPRWTSSSRKRRASGSRWARSRSESERLMPIYAGIDIGTLTLRLLIARIGDEGRLHELASERRIVRLGEGLQPGRRLQPAPMARALETIAEWMPVIKRAGAREVVAVATSAVRDAVNRDEFLGEIKRRSGLAVEVVSGEEEARLSLLGIQSGLPAGVDRFVALDIGGGSTEFITVTPGQAPAMVSVDEGVVRLTEECLRSDPVRADELAAARARRLGAWSRGPHTGRHVDPGGKPGAVRLCRLSRQRLRPSRRRPHRSLAAVQGMSCGIAGAELGGASGWTSRGRRARHGEHA